MNSMDIIIYFAMLLPAAIMILAGLMISSVRQDNIMTNHHFATNFNINGYAKKVMKLFTVCGLLFSLSGIVIINLSIPGGFILLAVTVAVFAIVFAKLLKNG